jgi:hypothetical protein
MLIQTKTILILFIVFYMLCSQKAYSQLLLKGGIQTSVQKGSKLEIKLSAPLNFYFSAEGDKIQGLINEDIKVSDDLVIPRGSLISGYVKKIIEPKHFGKDGSFEVEFDEIITPHNISIPIQASTSTDTKSVSEKTADIVTYDSALIAYGTFNGALAGLQYGGIPLAVSSHGISVLAGASVGAGAGIVGSLIRKGKIPITTYGSTSSFLLKSNLYILGNQDELKAASGKRTAVIPEYKGFRFNPVVNKQQVEVNILSHSKLHDKKYGNYIEIKLNIKNNSNRSISISDFKLANIKQAKKEYLNPDLFLTGLESLKTIKPGNELEAKVTYLIPSKKENYSIVLVDPLDMNEIVTIKLI